VEREQAISDLLGKMDLRSDDRDNINLLRDAHDIYRKLKIIRESVMFKIAEYPTALDSNMYFRKEKMNLEMNVEELEILLRKFSKIHEAHKVQYKA
jgi:uncharacterized protein YjbK